MSTSPRLPDDSWQFALSRLSDFIAVNADAEEGDRTRALITLADYLGFPPEQQEWFLTVICEALDVPPESPVLSGYYAGVLTTLLAVDHAELSSPQS